VWPPGP